MSSGLERPLAWVPAAWLGSADQLCNLPVAFGLVATYPITSTLCQQRHGEPLDKAGAMLSQRGMVEQPLDSSAARGAHAKPGWWGWSRPHHCKLPARIPQCPLVFSSADK